MLISSRSSLLRRLACKLRRFLDLLQMITARIIKRPSILKHLRLSRLTLPLRLRTNKLTLWIILSQLWFGILNILVVNLTHMVCLKSSYSSCSFGLLHDGLRSWVFSRMLARFLCTFNVLWASRVIRSFHFWLTKFFTVTWFMSRFSFLFRYFNFRKFVTK